MNLDSCCTESHELNFSVIYWIARFYGLFLSVMAGSCQTVTYRLIVLLICDLHCLGKDSCLVLTHCPVLPFKSSGLFLLTKFKLFWRWATYFSCIFGIASITFSSFQYKIIKSQGTLLPLKPLEDPFLLFKELITY